MSETLELSEEVLTKLATGEYKFIRDGELESPQEFGYYNFLLSLLFLYTSWRH